MRKYENKKMSKNESKKIKPILNKSVYSSKHTGSPKKIDKYFTTLNTKEINEVIVMVFTQLVEVMIKNKYDNINLDQLMLMKHEFIKVGIV